MLMRATRVFATGPFELKSSFCPETVTGAWIDRKIVQYIISS